MLTIAHEPTERKKKKKKASNKAAKENGDSQKAGTVANGKPKKALPPPKPLLANPYKKEISVAREEDFMSDLLGGLDKAPRSPSPPAKLKRKAQIAGTSSNGGVYGAFRNVKSTPSSSAFATSSDPILEGDSSIFDTAPSSDGLFDIPSDANATLRSSKKARISGTETQLDNLFLDSSIDAGDDLPEIDMDDSPSAEVNANGKIKKEEDDNEDDDMLVVKAIKKGKSTAGAKRQLVNSTSTKITKPLPKTEEDEQMDVKGDIKPVKTLKDSKKSRGMDWQIAAAAVTFEGDMDADDTDIPDEDIFTASAKPKRFKAPSAGGGSLQTAKVQALEEDGSVRFYWLDYVETNGVLHFIGKVFDKETKKYVSCALTVEGIDRNLFVLPRQAGTDGEDKTRL